ncbi:hypothetical protein BN440_3917 [Erwinia amylovora MR1]|nr:hypothetical protein BN440_3917 [Erwinia amylovora MR1]
MIAGYLSTKMTGALTSGISAPIMATGSTPVLIRCVLIPALANRNSALFITLFIAASYSRLVSSSAVTVPFPDDKLRAGFSLLQTAMMYLITTIAFFLSALILPDQGMTPRNLNRLLVICAGAASGFPVFIIILQKKLANRFCLSTISTCNQERHVCKKPECGKPAKDGRLMR